MRTQLYILIFTFIFLTFLTKPLHASDHGWQVVNDGEGFALMKGAEKYPIDFDVGTPRYLETIQLNENFHAVVYASGDVGTSTIIRIQRALLFNGERYLDNVPYLYIDLRTQSELGPKWEISADKIVITDHELGGKWVFEHQQNN
ncbi:hypothetical protein QTP81_07550 [Alteromonas sp. ASW11-36]|uniref:Uncharacterized protein n=1 Tax=Alteromonas arenosi TaxID=3055817 RepID=A0ABT7SY39_9ALTE|nr:hypothetical protein [Alteromonas sp. ASW11-36]MDM7860447.1 hypothetical protein [Alteromonas sp. ASW11-36]